jgi:dephospho-CoA kinase
VLRSDGHLDRAALRTIVFDSPAELEALNAIVHPKVEERRQTLLLEARTQGDRIVVCDIPLLFEKGMERAFDFVVLVDASETIRRGRLMTQRALSIDAANGMIAAQMPSAKKRARANYIIDNDGTLADLDAQILELWSRLDALAPLPQ